MSKKITQPATPIFMKDEAPDGNSVVIDKSKDTCHCTEEEEGTDILEILESIPEEEKRDKARRILCRIERSSFSGPIPHPELLRGYDSVVAGSADRILKMAENQQAHRINIEKTIVNSKTNESIRGQTWGGILVLLLIAATVILGLFGHDILAGTIGTTTILGIGTIFVLNKTTDKESEKKNK